MHGDEVHWEPIVPANAEHWSIRIANLIKLADKSRRTGAYLRLSTTSKTGSTWGLPAIASCPVQDEMCQKCYALGGWYQTDHRLQIDRVLRLEYLQRLIRQQQLESWVQWMAQELAALPTQEPFPSTLRQHAYAGLFDPNDGVRYFRWHDSGDLFNAAYTVAVFQVCEATPAVLHWLPTRNVKLILALVRKGVKIPANLSVMVSIHHGGVFEQAQLRAVCALLTLQPKARIGLSYVLPGTVGRSWLPDNIAHGSFLCPASNAKDPKERNCKGCRRCWAARIDSPVIYPES